MAEKGIRIKADATKAGWEDVEFPILCETCMGDNPYVRMMREKFGGACHVCERPHTKFRWKAGSAGRFKTTVICQGCAKLKNVCQCCMLDLTYGMYAAAGLYLCSAINLFTDHLSRQPASVWFSRARARVCVAVQVFPRRFVTR